MTIMEKQTAKEWGNLVISWCGIVNLYYSQDSYAEVKRRIPSFS
jgi:hypothetical protein